VEAVDVLAGVHAIEHAPLVDALGQGKLDEDAVDGRVVVEALRARKASTPSRTLRTVSASCFPSRMRAVVMGGRG
jgi:hypothetical protein